MLSKFIKWIACSSISGKIVMVMNAVNSIINEWIITESANLETNTEKERERQRDRQRQWQTISTCLTSATLQHSSFIKLFFDWEAVNDTSPEN